MPSQIWRGSFGNVQASRVGRWRLLAACSVVVLTAFGIPPSGRVLLCLVAFSWLLVVGGYVAERRLQRPRCEVQSIVGLAVGFLAGLAFASFLSGLGGDDIGGTFVLPAICGLAAWLLSVLCPPPVKADRTGKAASP